MTPTTKFLLAYAGYVAGIHLVDGPWRNWSRGSVVDAWSLTHIGWGMIARRMQVPYRTFMLLGAGNEQNNRIREIRGQKSNSTEARQDCQLASVYNSELEGILMVNLQLLGGQS